MRRNLATWWLVVGTVAPAAACQTTQPIEDRSIPRPTRDVGMPTGDDARGVPMPEGAIGHEVYRARRRRLMEEMEGGVAVIFGAGAVLHYRDDNREMQTGELVLCDVGSEYEHYASDVTRTFPISGKFSPRQREVYEIVLRAQKVAIAGIKPGALIRDDVHEPAQRVIEEAGFTDRFFHSASHFVGIRVHDAGLSAKPLTVGTVITVEPGIYLADENLGIRIEDEVLVTEDGHEVLTQAIPKTVAEIEAVMSSAQRRKVARGR